MRFTIIIQCFTEFCHFLRLLAAWTHRQSYAYCSLFLMDVFAPIPKLKETYACGPISQSVLLLTLTLSLTLSSSRRGDNGGTLTLAAGVLEPAPAPESATAAAQLHCRPRPSYPYGTQTIGASPATSRWCSSELNGRPCRHGAQRGEVWISNLQSLESK